MSTASGLLRKRLQRILLFGLVIFALAPIALGLLLLFTQNSGVAAGFLTIYYGFAIIALAIIVFTQLAIEILKPPHASH